MRMRYATQPSPPRSCWPPPSRPRSSSPRMPPRSPPPRVQQTAPHSPRDAPDTPVTPPPPDRCTTPTDPTCIRAVYKGAPDDYAQVQDIPDSVLIQPDDDGRYQVERGQQITVVTAAPLPADYTRFYLQRQPLQVTVSPTSFQQLIPPVGTTYTFTVTTDDGLHPT